MEPDDLINEYLDLPQIEVLSMMAKKGWRLPPYMDLEDLIQAGYIGLIDAANKYNKDKGGWISYARTRIRGAVIDWMRTASWSTRTDRAKAKKNDEEIKKMYGGENSTLINSIEITSKTVVLDTPLDTSDFLQWFLSGLTDENKKIVYMYYAHDLTMAQIGKKLNLTESAICLRLQKIARWIADRKKDLSDYDGIKLEEIINV